MAPLEQVTTNTHHVGMEATEHQCSGCQRFFSSGNRLAKHLRQTPACRNRSTPLDSEPLEAARLNTQRTRALRHRRQADALRARLELLKAPELNGVMWRLTADSTSMPAREAISSAQLADPEMRDVVAYLRQEPGLTAAAAGPASRVPCFELTQLFGLDNFRLSDDGLLLFEGAAARRQGSRRNAAGKFAVNEARIVVPLVLRQRIFELFHAHIQSGAHMGVSATFDTMRERFFWPRMRADISERVSACTICQARSVTEQGKSTPEASAPVSDPFEEVTMDVLGPLHVTPTGYRYLLILIDTSTRWVIAVPMKTCTAVETARAIVLRLWCEYGTCPRRIRSDQGSNFTADVTTKLLQMLGVEPQLATAYHPESQGKVERYNHTITAALAKFVNQGHDDWDVITPYVAAAYKTSTHRALGGHSPYEMLFAGARPRIPADVPFEVQPLAARGGAFAELEDVWSSIATWRKEIAANEQDKAQTRYNAGAGGRREGRVYSPGDLVMIHRTRAAAGQNKKLVSSWRGPYMVIRAGKNRLEYWLSVNDSHDQEAQDAADPQYGLRWNAANMKPFLEAPDGSPDSDGDGSHAEPLISPVRRCIHATYNGGRKGDAILYAQARAGPNAALQHFCGTLARDLPARFTRRVAHVQIHWEDGGTNRCGLGQDSWVESSDKIVSEHQWCYTDQPPRPIDLRNAVRCTLPADDVLCNSIASNGRKVAHAVILMADGREVFWPRDLLARHDIFRTITHGPARSLE
jgi:transposase InsO family protein